MGKVCPFCLLIVRKKVGDLSTGDILTVKTDHPPAAIDTIPHEIKKLGNHIESKKLEPGVWELKITIK